MLLAGAGAGLVAMIAALSLSDEPVSARQRYQVKGPAACLNCHTHAREKRWAESGELAEVAKLWPDKGKTAGHINADSQLADPRAAGYAKAIGVSDPYDANGRCVTCHATVVNGDPQSGVTCEACHGASSGYLTVHQTAGAYQQAVAAGMIDVRRGPSEWAKQCLGCHIVNDQKLVAAGHYSGRDFNLQEKYRPVSLHFAKSRPAAEVAAAAASLRGSATAPPPAPTPAPAPAPPAPQPTTPAPPPPSPGTGGTPTPAPPPPPAPSPGGSARPASPPPVTPSPVAAAPDPAAAAPPPSPPPPPDPNAAGHSPSAALAAVQGRLIAQLTELLQKGGSAPVRLPSGARLVPYNGPDAALLELQAEAIALALQVLGKPPAPPKKDLP
jgi:hypothetical protein